MKDKSTENVVYQPSKSTWFLILSLVLVYFIILLNFPKSVRFGLVGISLFFVVLYHIHNPRSWLLLFPVAIVFGRATFDYGPFYIGFATIAVLVASLFYYTVKIAGFNSFPRFPLPVYLVLAAFLAQVASAFASLHYHDNLVSNTIREAGKLFIAASILPLVYDWYGRGKWLVRMLKVTALMLLVMCVYGIYQYSAGSLDVTGEQASGFDLAGRVYSTVNGGPNSYSGVLELLVPAVLASMFVFKRRIWKAIALIAVILGVQNVLYTFSRGGFLTVSIACFVFLVYRNRRRIWVPVVALSLFAGVLLANAGEFKRQLTVFGDTKSLIMDTSLLHRYTSYKGFISAIEASPVVGVGWGSREFFHGRTSLYSFWEVRHEDSINKITRFGGLNSLILEMPYKGGLFSMLSLLLLITAFVTVSVKVLKSGVDKSLGMGLISGLVAFGVHQAVDNLTQWPQTGAFFWLVFGLLISVAYPCCGKEVD
jgi:O-antigen ligase